MKVSTQSFREKYSQLITAQIRWVQDHWEQNQDKWHHRPMENAWSAAECLEHLNLTMAFYLDQINRRIESRRRNNQESTEFIKRTWMGQKLEKNMLPPKDGRSGAKVPTFKSISPAEQIDLEETVGNFFEKCHNILHILNDLDRVNLNKVKARTLIGPWPRLKAPDAIALMSAHNKRHIEQAKRALNTND